MTDQTAIRSLAVAYHSFLDASLGNHEEAQIRLWASALLRAQRATGVELLPTAQLLYPMTGDATELRAVMPAPEPEPTRGELRASSGMIEGGDEDDGGALVPLPIAPPRKPSPGAAIAAQAAQFYAARR